jgi:hypothetical protein
LDREFKRFIAKAKAKEASKIPCNTVNKHKPILSNVNNTVNDMLPDIGRKSRKSITFTKK